MSVKIKILLVTFVLMIGYVLGSCTNSQSYSEQNYPVKIWKQNTNGQYSTYVIVDEDTGVNYIVVGVQYSNGHSVESVSITPRLNSDGGLYITK